MNRKVMTALMLGAFAVFITGAVALYNGLSGSVEPRAVESEASASETIPAPDFTVKDVDGEDVMLSDLRGKPVVLNFWASWCPPCKAEMPNFEKVYAELGDEVHFMMVDMVDGSRETVELGAKHVQDNGYTFPVYYDVGQEAAYQYRVNAIPTTFFIDSEGNVVTYATRMLSEDNLRFGIAMIQDKTAE